MKRFKKRNYFDLVKLPTFEERFEYLKLNQHVGEDTFGFQRWLNQKFYKSREWLKVRDIVIVRDNGCDLGVPGCEIQSQIYIHHMTPITPDDIINENDDIVNPKFLITVSFDTHEAIHYGDRSILPRYNLIERLPGDTTLW